MAQMASRASIEFYVGLALQARGDSEIAKGGTVTEEAFVIRTFRNGVAVFVHRYVGLQPDPSPKPLTLNRLGIEGLVTFKQDIEFDQEAYAISVTPQKASNRIQIAVFDRVTVRITVEKDQTTKRGKVKMALVEPVSSDEL